MLSLWKLRVGAEAYYLSQVARGIDDYYTGAGEADGRWLGTAADILNLPAEVTGEDLRAVLAGLAPGTGLSPNGTQIRPFKGRVPGFDLTFSAPKSVSVMYAFADPLVRAQVIAAVDKAVEESLSWLEREACFVRRGSNNRRAKVGPFEQWGTRRLPGAGFIAAGFRHRTSRAGDPQLHTHVLVANLTRGPDGRWSALDGQAIYRSKLAAGVLFQTVLRDELSRRLGVRWRPAHGHVADIAGVPQRVLSHFSKRRNEIEDELERSGLSGPAAADRATLATRPEKVEIDAETLDQLWLDDGSSIGFRPADIDTLLANRTPTTQPLLAPETRIATRSVDRITGEVTEQLLTISQFAHVVAWALPERDATVTRLDIQNAVADHLLGHGGAAFLERLTDAVLADDELVLVDQSEPAEAGWEQRWTTRRMIRIEHELRRHFAPMAVLRHALDAPSVTAALADFSNSLGADQFDTVVRLATQGLAVEVVVGRAGTGKTYTMNAVRHVFTTHHRRVIGVCPTGRAARELADGASIDAYTVPGLLNHATLGPDDVLIVDESGMCGTVDLHRIITHAHHAGAKLILVGDHRQLPEVAAGGAFAAALDAVGAQRCELTVNRRQSERWEHVALDHLRDGDVTAFWDAYRTRERIVLTDTRTQLHADAINAWSAHHLAGLDAHLIAGTRAEARLLNQLARHQVAVAGRLHGPPLVVREREFQVGDRIVLLQNMPGQTDLTDGARCRVDNGMIASITAIDHRNGDVDIAVVGSHRHIRLTGEYVQSGAVDHGYATTIHKAQGVTCDRIHVVGPAGLYREAAYVALSRARHSAHLYATTAESARVLGEPAHTTGIPHPDENLDDPEADLTRALNTRRNKCFVTTDHPDLERIADLARRQHLGDLRDRRRQLRAIIGHVESVGLDDPSHATEQLHLAEQHRRRMHVGGRVNARDWDNVGTIERLHDTIGQASIRFTSDTGHTTTRLLPWHLLKPIDNPDEAEPGDLAAAHLSELADALRRDRHTWNAALTEYGVEPGELELINGAIRHRTEHITRALRATPPEWLTWWVGLRPTDPAAAVVYDDLIADLAAWRDQQQVPDDIPGYGEPPDDPELREQWRQLTDRALAIRRFLTDHQPVPERIEPIGVAVARDRLDELDAVLATAPPDQRLVVEQLLATAGDDLADIVEGIRTSTDRQDRRRDWILEHWPHIVEHHQLTTLTAGADPLAHWPTPIDPRIGEILDTIADLTATDEPEPLTLSELDRMSLDTTPALRIRQLESDLADVQTQIVRLRHEPHRDEQSAALAQQHIERLCERNATMQRDIDTLEARCTVDRWKAGPGAELSQRIERRIDQLAHRAACERAPWIVKFVERSTESDVSVDAERLLGSIRRRAAAIDRGTIEHSPSTHSIGLSPE